MTTYLSPGVYVKEEDKGSKPIEGVGTAVAAFVGFTERFPADDHNDPKGIRPRRVSNWSRFTELYGGFVEGAMLPHAVYGYFNNGGGSAYIVRVPHTEGDAPAPIAALPSHTKDDTETLQIEANDPKANVEVEIEHQSPDDDGNPQAFNLKVFLDGNQVEQFNDLTFARGGPSVESDHITVTALKTSISNQEKIPAAGRHDLAPSQGAPVAVGPADFEGSEPDRTGIQGLVVAENVTMICVPDLVTAVSNNGEVDLGMFKAVQSALITHCELSGTRMAILDSPPGMDAQEVATWRSNEAMYDSKFAALYYPWIRVTNPLADPQGPKEEQTILVPPSGHVAGIWARNDSTRGVWKAPANEVVRGAVDVELKITGGEQDLNNPIGVNCIRPFGTRGIRVWGGRTLSSDPSWRYVNVRRLFNYVEESILQGTQWVVFEPNDLALWQRVKRTIYSFLLGLWRQGALFGATPAEAFYVKCDEETNPPESVDEGKLVVEIGIAPVKPAEFVIFRISQWQGGASTAE